MGALLISGCHKDSFDFDEFIRPTAATPDDTELPPPPTPNIGIFSPPTAQEGEQVVLMITSDADAPVGGLVVMISIGVAIADEFTTNPAAACTNFPICTVRILEGNRAVDLVLMPTSDSAAETERWTATLVDGGDDYNFADRNNNVAFDITDPPPTPGPMIPSLPVIGIATGDMPIEDGAGVTLTITSSETVPATLTGGLSVTINIVGADAADFNNAVCTNLVCIVTIPAGSNSVSLILSPLSDFSTETGEMWTATLVDGSNYNLDAGNNNVGFDITDLIAAVGIATSDAVMEGNAVVLTITSSIAAPTSGLTVTINIGVADMDEFESGDCSGLVCEVVIAATEMTALLTITASSGDEAENVEMWTATIEPDTAIFNVDPANDDDTFDITNLPLPAAANLETLANLNAYDLPTTLAANAIRNLQSDAIDGVAITASRYDDASSMPQVYVQMLEFAALGIWVNGNTPEINGDDHDFDYAFLGDNVVAPPTTGVANYTIEGDATYRGVNFFLDGSLGIDFGGGNTLGSLFSDGGNALDDYGSATAMVPDLNDLDGDGDTAELRPLAVNDDLNIDLSGTITNDGLGFTSALDVLTATGFFADLDSGVTAIGTTMAGRFYDASGYDSALGDPSEIAGAGIITDGDGTGNLHFGFLGRCFSLCTP